MGVNVDRAPEGWSFAPLGRLCGRITTGKLDANAMVEDGEYAFFTCARESYRINKYAFDTEALLVSGIGANVGYVHHYKGKFNAYQRTYVLTDFAVDTGFLKIFLDRNIQERIRVEVNAGNTPYITMGTLTDMQVLYPEQKTEQIAIASAVRDVDALLSGLDQLIAKKRDLKQATMQQLLTGQTRLPGFSENWTTKRLGEVVTIKKGQLITSNELVAGDVPVIAGGKQPAYFHSSANRVGRTITISASGANAGYVALYKEPIFASDCSTISEEESYCLDFIFYQLQCNQQMIYGTQTGGAQPHVHAKDLYPLEFRYPSVTEQMAIAEVLNNMDAELAALEARREKTRALKQGMMQELLTGRTRLV